MTGKRERIPGQWHDLNKCTLHPLNARFLSLKHLDGEPRRLPRCRTSQIVSQGCMSMTGRRNESQVSGMI